MTIQSNFSLRTALYHGQFVWSQKCQKSNILNLYNTDTSVKRTLGSVPLVSILKRFNCSNFQIMRAYSSEGNHGSRLCFTWIITSQWIFSQSQWKNLSDKLQHLLVQCHTTFEWCCILTMSMKPGQNIYGNNLINSFHKAKLSRKRKLTSLLTNIQHPEPQQSEINLNKW